MFELLSSPGVLIIIIIIITTTRYDKLYIDNEPYVWDEEENRVLPARFFLSILSWKISFLNNATKTMTIWF